MKITVNCGCGGKSVGRGRTLVCSNRKCGTVIMRETRNESIKKGNEVFNGESPAKRVGDYFLNDNAQTSGGNPSAEYDC